MFSCLQILEAFLWFVLITLLNVTLIILTLSVSRLLNLLLRLVAFLLFLNPQCLASISRSEERFSRNAETDIVCRLLLEKKNGINVEPVQRVEPCAGQRPAESGQDSARLLQHRCH